MFNVEPTISSKNRISVTLNGNKPKKLKTADAKTHPQTTSSANLVSIITFLTEIDDSNIINCGILIFRGLCSVLCFPELRKIIWVKAPE